MKHPHLWSQKSTRLFCIDNLEQALDFCIEDLPNADLVDEEYHLWKFRWLSIPKQERPQTLSDSMKHCCLESLPNIHTLLKLFATLPPSSCSCEHSASSLRRLNNYLRCTQTEKRLSALALIHSNYHESVDIACICKLFVEKYAGRIECANVV